MSKQYYNTNEQAVETRNHMIEYGWPTASVEEWEEGYVIRACGDDEFPQYLQDNGFVTT